MGFDDTWVTETIHSSYVASALLAERADAIDIGTNIAVAFPRTPMITAYTAWELQSLSAGPFRSRSRNAGQRTIRSRLT